MGRHCENDSVKLFFFLALISWHLLVSSKLTQTFLIFYPKRLNNIKLSYAKCVRRIYEKSNCTLGSILNFSHVRWQYTHFKLSIQFLEWDEDGVTVAIEYNLALSILWSLISAISKFWFEWNYQSCALIRHRIHRENFTALKVDLPI